MESGFHTLQEFLTHTKGVIYILMVCILIGMTGFFRFLMEDKDKDDDAPNHGGH